MGSGEGVDVCVDKSQAEEDEVLRLEFPSRPMLMTWARVYGDGELLIVVLSAIQLHV